MLGLVFLVLVPKSIGQRDKSADLNGMVGAFRDMFSPDPSCVPSQVFLTS